MLYFTLISSAVRIGLHCLLLCQTCDPERMALLLVPYIRCQQMSLCFLFQSLTLWEDQIRFQIKNQVCNHPYLKHCLPLRLQSKNSDEALSCSFCSSLCRGTSAGLPWRSSLTLCLSLSCSCFATSQGSSRIVFSS